VQELAKLIELRELESAWLGKFTAFKCRKAIMMSGTEKEILFLSLEDVIKCGGSDIPLAADDILKGFHLLLEDKILQPFKTTLKAKGAGHEHKAGLVNFLPACISLGDEEIYGCKSLGAMPSNVNLGIPRATGLITLFDSETKSPVCVMDAQVISATRTGAVTMLAAKKLVGAGVEEAGLVGAGVNMRTQLLGLKAALPGLKRARVYSRHQAKYRFAAEMPQKSGVEIWAVETPREAVENARLIVTCLPNVSEPVVKAEWVMEKGVTMINIGCYESETILLKRMDRVIADMWEQGKHRGVQTHAIAVAQGVISESMLEDVGYILTGKKPGRQSESENIFFAPTGLGFEDVIVAWRVYNEALRQGTGTKLTLWKSSRWL
jgi:ornithine cyclodeaminase